jgi:hypothetical protein
MPTHTKERASADGGAAKAKKTKVSASSGDAATSKRGVGGKKKGKAAIRAEAKNAGVVKAVLDVCRGAADEKELLADLQEADLTLARVTAAPGGRHLVVTLMTGAAGVVVPISGVTAFRGGARTKGELPNHMGVGDLVVLYGAHARGKIPPNLANEVRDICHRLGVAVPAEFFPASERDGGVGWCFDREDERLGEEAGLAAAAETAAAAAAAARAAREGGYGDGKGALGAAARAALYGADRGARGGAGAADDDVDVEAI